MEKSAEFKNENCVKWLADIRASMCGSKQQLTMRLNQLSTEGIQDLSRNSRQSQKKLTYFLDFLVVLIPQTFQWPQPSGGQLTKLCPRSTVKCLLSMFP